MNNSLNRSRVEKKISRWLLPVLLLATLMVLLAGCSGPPERLFVESPGWSRAVYLGNTLTGDPAPLATDHSGRVFTLFFKGDEGQQRPEIVAVGPDGEIEYRRQLDVLVARAEDPYLRFHRDQLHAMWVDAGHLYYLPLDPSSGQPQSDRVDLSGGRLVGHFDAAIGDQDQLTVWFAGPRRQPGLYRLPTLDQQPVLVDIQGFRPDLAEDSQGELHAIWAHYPTGFGDLEYFHAAVPHDQDGPLAEVEATLIAQPAIGPTSVLQGPVLAAAQEQGYVFWTILQRTGISAGSSRTRFATFNLQEPNLIEQEDVLLIPSDYRLPYQTDDTGQFAVGDRVSLPVDGMGISGYVADVAAISHDDGEVATAISSRMTYLRNKNEIQTGIIYLRQGEMQEYQLLSFTQAASVTPTIHAGTDGDLYLTWMEKGEVPGFLVYLTSTESEMVQGLAQLKNDDVARLAADTTFGMLTGMLIAPIATLVSLVVPLLIIGLTAFLRGEDEGLLAAGTLITLGLALGAYWVGKIGVMPTIGEYVPFSAWIPILPAWLETPLRLGMPVLIGLIGFAVAWSLTYRREVRSPIYFVLIYAAVDGLLTGAIYGLHFYAAF